jgi:SAM-dependent methyltransferase
LNRREAVENRWPAATSAKDAQQMRPEEYERMYALENTYWWFQGRKEIVLRLLRRYTPLGDDDLSVLDVGCGTGLMLDSLRPYARPVGLDFSRLSMTYCARRGIERLVCARVEALPFGVETFDLLLALDLFEHIDDDAALMREMWRLCRPGGHLLITVPAYPFLWSEHDEALHHRRRYCRSTLRQLIALTDFEVVRFTSAIALMLPPIVTFRLAQKVFKPKGENAPKTHLISLPQTINRLLIALLKTEAQWLQRFNLPFGVSLVALLRKPESK